MKNWYTPVMGSISETLRNFKDKLPKVSISIQSDNRYQVAYHAGPQSAIIHTLRNAGRGCLPEEVIPLLTGLPQESTKHHTEKMVDSGLLYTKERSFQGEPVTVFCINDSPSEKTP